MWLLRPTLQPEIAFLHITGLIVAGMFYLMVRRKNPSSANLLGWLVVASSAAACLVIALESGGDATVRVIIGRRYGATVAFWVYAAIATAFSAVFLLQRHNHRASTRQEGMASIEFPSQFWRTSIVFVAFNGLFVALPFLLARPVDVEVRSVEDKPLVGTLVYHSDLTGRQVTLNAGREGRIRVNLLWRDIVKGRIQAEGFAPVDLYLSREYGDYAVGRTWYYLFPPPVGTIHVEQTFSANSPAHQDAVRVYLVGIGRIQVTPYEELHDLVKQLKRGNAHNKPLRPELTPLTIECYLQLPALEREMADPTSPVQLQARIALGTLKAENGKLRELCRAISEDTSGMVREIGLGDLYGILVNSSPDRLLWTEKRDAIERRLFRDLELFAEVTAN